MVNRLARPMIPHRGIESGPDYGSQHRALRKAWAGKVRLGLVACWRCGVTIRPGDAWDLGHNDMDLTTYIGPEHAHCNRSAGGAKGNARRWHDHDGVRGGDEAGEQRQSGAW